MLSAVHTTCVPGWLACLPAVSLFLLGPIAANRSPSLCSIHLCHLFLHIYFRGIWFIVVYIGCSNCWPSCFVCADFPKWCFVHCEFKAQQVASLRPELFRHTQRNGADSRAAEELMFTSKEVAVFCPHGALAAKKELTIIIFAA